MTGETLTKEDIVRMAREAGLAKTRFYKTKTVSKLENIEAIEKFFHMAQAAEREACAKMCEEKAKIWRTWGYLGSLNDYKECADAIRARGNT